MIGLHNYYEIKKIKIKTCKLKYILAITMHCWMRYKIK